MAFCAVPSCAQFSEQLVFATPKVFTYYAFKNRKPDSVKVCPACFEKADLYHKKAVDALKTGTCLFELKSEPQHFPPTVDHDVESSSAADTSKPKPSNEASSEEEEMEMDVDRQDVEGLVKSMFSKFNIIKQVKDCNVKVAEEAATLGGEMMDLEQMFEKTSEMLHETCKRFNNIYDKTPKPIVIQEVEINADGRVRQRRTSRGNTVSANPDALAKLAEKARLESKVENDEIIEETETNERDRWLTKASSVRLHPTPRHLNRIKLKIGDIIYGLNVSALNYWLQAEILEIVDNKDTNQKEYIVQFEPTKDGVPTGATYEKDDGSVRIIRQLCLREMAYNYSAPFVIPVGTRVIAKYKDEVNRRDNGRFYSGVVAETPKKSSTGDRYLIFFEDGYAQYVFPKDVMLVCECSRDVYNDIHPNSYDFIKAYLTRFPDWPKVKLLEGSIISTEWNGKWLIARVTELDASLAKVKFQNDGREEWIYRGSPRFRRIYTILKDLEEGPRRNKNPKVPLRQANSDKSDENPVVHETVILRKGHLALKRTGGKLTRSIFTDTHSDMTDRTDPDAAIEFQGCIDRLQIPDEFPRPRDFVPHECDKSCVIEYVPTLETKSRSPLSIPLFHGWSREIGKYPRRSVFYRTPCGRRLRDYDELYSFLRTTQSNMSIDFFCFNHLVDCLSVFVPARTLHVNPDISNGKEAVPIQCINSLDNDTLPHLDYIPDYIIGEDVDYNPDTGFMSCCDCTDDCLDQDKCACWQLTKQGLSFTKMNNDPTQPRHEGYVHRRLGQHVVSGIYECNSNCKCKKTCSNRVVQNGVMWPIQIFKTTRKGWGIRALYDMPDGSFICLYAGEILSEKSANDVGLEHGDEYLALLDFIEINQMAKADYESDVEQIEEYDEDEDVVPVNSPGKKFRMEENVGKEKSRKFTARGTGGQKTCLDYLLNVDADSITARAAASSQGKRKRLKVNLRNFFEEDKQSYTINAKKKGNFGRYLNHSCNPNVMVQNVFVNTQDLRFPIPAFFTNGFVKAGTELTWDYSYQIGSVPDKIIYCYCMTQYCRGRLL